MKLTNSPNMIRDLTMIISVLVSLVSVGFGVYKNIEANNAKGFAYQQAYRVINAVEGANISGAAKASVTSAALDALTTPAPVLDLSQSSASNGKPGACTAQQQNTCVSLAAGLATANASCNHGTNQDACTTAGQLKGQIAASSCYTCFNQ